MRTSRCNWMKESFKPFSVAAMLAVAVLPAAASTIAEPPAPAIALVPPSTPSSKAVEGQPNGASQPFKSVYIDKELYLMTPIGPIRLSLQRAKAPALQPRLQDLSLGA
jgi:hypothetical protein